MPGFVDKVYLHQDQSQRAPWGEKQLSLSGLWLELQRLQEATSKDFLQCQSSCQTWQWEACFLLGELEQPYPEVQGITFPIAENLGGN